MRRTLNSLALVALFSLLSVASAQEPNGRQYYSAWNKHTSRPYYYRSYFYKPTAASTSYQYHYGIYYPSRGKRVYMYNPQAKTYWGYWEDGKYSILPLEKRKASIDEIAAEDFPAPAVPPAIPDVADGIKMIAPPSDFPKTGDLPK